MYNKFLILMALGCMVFSGCASTTGNYEKVTKEDIPVVRRFVSLSQLQEGLARTEAKALLGGQVITGYEMPDTRTKRYKPVVTKNPYRTQELKSYVIDYYFVGINKADDNITDDELAPLVFKDDKLLGWGWEYFHKIRK